jgi:hypothetical protein
MSAVGYSYPTTNIDYHKELLLHQVTELIPTLFMKAAEICNVKPIEKDFENGNV